MPKFSPQTKGGYPYDIFRSMKEGGEEFHYGRVRINGAYVAIQWNGEGYPIPTLDGAELVIEEPRNKYPISFKQITGESVTQHRMDTRAGKTREELHIDFDRFLDRITWE